jgi:hypothetical protein
MDTPSKCARIFIREQKTGLELPNMKLNKTGLILVCMDKPGQLSLDVRTEHPTKMTAVLDGQAVPLYVDDYLQPGQHLLTSSKLAFKPSATAAVPVAQATAESTEQNPVDPDDSYLESLGVVIEGKPSRIEPSFIGGAGGVLKLQLSYFIEDNGVLVEDRNHDSDVLVFKLNGTDDFNQAVASNVHRLEFPKDESKPEVELCATCRMSGPGHHHHH